MRTGIPIFVILLSCILSSCRPSVPLAGAEEGQDPFEDGGVFSRYMDSLSERDLFSGAVLIARGDTVLFEGAWGLADRDAKEANESDTRFNICSCGKMFTAVAVAQLAESGLVRFSDTIGQYVEGFAPDIAGRVTVEHLLTHTSGIAPEEANALNDAQDVNDLMEIARSLPFEYEPGEQYLYSNANYIILGAVIESVTGQSYYDYVRQQVFGKAGMADTDFLRKDSGAPDMARGYYRSLFGWKDNYAGLHMMGGPSGGAYSTVGDMFLFARALFGNRLLKEEYTKTVIQGKVSDGGEGMVAYGMVVLEGNGSRPGTVGSTGATRGANAVFKYVPDMDITFVVLSNYDEGAMAPYDEIMLLLSSYME